MRMAGVLAALVLAGLAPTGCAGKMTKPSEVTESAFEYSIGTNRLVLRQPKDVEFDILEAKSPDGSTLRLSGYKSTANAAAIAAVRAQAEAQKETARAGYEFGERMFEKGVKAAAQSFSPVD